MELEKQKQGETIEVENLSSSEENDNDYNQIQENNNDDENIGQNDDSIEQENQTITGTQNAQNTDKQPITTQNTLQNNTTNNQSKRQQGETEQQEKQKENMQQTIKSLQERSNHIEKLLEKGKDVLVIQYSSDTIKYGFANQKYPQKIKNQIAYKLKRKIEDPKRNFHQQREYPVFEKEDLDQAILNMEYHLVNKGNIKIDQKMVKGKPKAKQELDFKKPIQVRLDKEGNLIENKEVAFEDEVYLYEQSEEWAIKRPIKHGMFNFNNGKETLKSIQQDLEAITQYILQEKLNIKQSEYQNYNVILVLPDVFQREQVTTLIDMFLKNLQFRGIYLHLESVLATYGACLSSACIVDIGYQKINVCCVEDGCIIPNTLIRKNFGGEDIDDMFYRILLKRHSALFKKKGFKLEASLYGDINSLSRVKEKCGSFIQTEDKSNRIYDVNAIRKGNEEIYNVFHNEAVYLAPQTLFYKDVFNKQKRHTYLEQPLQKDGEYIKNDRYYFDFTERYYDLYWDNTDYLEDVSGGKQTNIIQNYTNMSTVQNENEINTDKQIKVENQEQQVDVNKIEIEQKQQTKKGRRKKQNEVQIQNQDEVYQQQQQLFQPKQKVTNEQMSNPFIMEDLDIIIAHSIGECRDLETRKKMANTILIVGGTVQFSKFVEELEDRLIETIPVYSPEIERVEVIDPLVTREILPSFVSWTGATVIPKLESTKDLWITRYRWNADISDEPEFEFDENDKSITSKKEKSNEYGLTVLKEKAPFQW